jgi:hypothetical protein
VNAAAAPVGNDDLEGQARVGDIVGIAGKLDASPVDYFWR